MKFGASKLLVFVATFVFSVIALPSHIYAAVNCQLFVSGMEDSMVNYPSESLNLTAGPIVSDVDGSPLSSSPNEFVVGIYKNGNLLQNYPATIVNGTLTPLDLSAVILSDLQQGQSWLNYEVRLTQFQGAGSGVELGTEACHTYMSVTNSASSNSSAPFNLCQQAANADELAACRACVGADTITDPNSQHFWTAFGCVRTSKEGLIQDFLRIGLGLAGGFVLLSILYGSFLLTTSSGDPKRVQEGQEMISSAVMGLLFVIFSVVILQFIGVSILHIPGL